MISQPIVRNNILSSEGIAPDDEATAEIDTNLKSKVRITSSHETKVILRHHR